MLVHVFRESNRTCAGVIVDVQGDKYALTSLDFSSRISSISVLRYFARVIQVFPPRASLLLQSSSKSEGQASSSSSPLSDEEPLIHRVAEDLKIPVKEANARDDPAKYYYKVQILEEEKQPGAGKVSDRNKGKDKQSKYSRSLMDVQCPDMRYARHTHASSVASTNLQFCSRDRLAFSKSILRRFIRDCVDRDAAVASPWTVKPSIAARYGVDSIMPEEIRKDIEALKKGESDKRKKVWEEKEGPNKRQKKLTAAEEEKGS